MKTNASYIDYRALLGKPKHAGKVRRSKRIAECLVLAACALEAQQLQADMLDTGFGSGGMAYLNFQPGAQYPVGDPGDETDAVGVTFQPTLELANGELVSFASRYEEAGSYTPESSHTEMQNVYVPGGTYGGHYTMHPGFYFCFGPYGGPPCTYIPGGTSWVPGTQLPGHWEEQEITVTDPQSGNITQSRMLTRMAKFNASGGALSSVDLGGILVFSALQQTDGKLVVAGMNFSRANGAWSGTKPDRLAQVVLKRFNLDGSPDITFDGDGTALPAITGAFLGMQSDGLVQMPDGKLLLLVNRVPDLAAPELARLNTNGSLDTTYGGGDGRQPLAIPNAYNMIRQVDGKLLLRYNDSNTQGFARVDTDGNLDVSFAGDGTLNTGLNFNWFDTGMLQQADSKLVFAHGNTLVRYNLDGTSDTTFSVSPTVTGFLSVSQLPSGEVLGLGAQIGAGNNARIVIYETNGVLNTTESLNLNTFANPATYPNDYVNFGFSGLQSNGRMLVSGTNAGGLALIQRYNAFGTPDIDSDGVINAADNCPVDANINQADFDGDGVGDVCDPDYDGDGINDSADNCPLISNADQANADSDSYGDVCEPDFDADTIINDNDNCPYTPNLDQANADMDSDGDVCDDDLLDTDHDTVVNSADNCPNNANTNQLDSDSDGIGNVCDYGADPDVDNDGILNGADNCPAVPNAGQADFNYDGFGDACTDADNDGLKDSVEIMLGTQLLNPDTDGDTWSDGEEVNIYFTDPLSAASKPADQDSDHIVDATDNCPAVYNDTQLNTDGDTQGDVCDLDDDNDGLSDAAEAIAGTNPADADTDDDGFNDAVDAYPLDPARWLVDVIYPLDGSYHGSALRENIVVQ